MKQFAIVPFTLFLLGCSQTKPERKPEAASGAQEFLRVYNELDQRLSTVAAEANWKASTDVTEEHTGERIGAEAALAAFRGSRYVI